MHSQFFTNLFDYQHHFNQLLIAKLATNPNFQKTSEKAILLLNHTINTHQIWNARIMPNDSETNFGVFQIHPIEDLPKIDLKNYQQTLQIIQSVPLQQIITYTNTKGEQFSNTAQDILFHIINHTTYHRGQIATECRINGIEPLVDDYIFYKRTANFVSP